MEFHSEIIPCFITSEAEEILLCYQLMVICGRKLDPISMIALLVSRLRMCKVPIATTVLHDESQFCAHALLGGRIE